VHAHEIATQRSAVALLASAASHQFGVDVLWAAIVTAIGAVRLASAAAVAPASTAASVARTATAIAGAVALAIS
jgi:hypothetical protein